jgi:C-terminal processing protease CtpA/Prc
MNEQVTSVVRGGPAYIFANIRKGDEIRSVDGHPVDAKNIIERLRGNDLIGSTCNLTVAKPGDASTVDVSLVRASSKTVSQCHEIMTKLGALEELVRYVRLLLRPHKTCKYTSRQRP